MISTRMMHVMNITILKLIVLEGVTIMGMPSMMIIVRPMMNVMNIKLSRADG